MNKNLIAVSGKIGAGKDAVSSIINYIIWREKVEKGIASSYGYTLDDFLTKPTLYNTYEIKKFSGKLKDITSLLTGIPKEKLEDQEFKKSYLGNEWWIEETGNMQVRTFMQKLGTDACRDKI